MWVDCRELARTVVSQIDVMRWPQGYARGQLQTDWRMASLVPALIVGVAVAGLFGFSVGLP